MAISVPLRNSPSLSPLINRHDSGVDMVMVKQRGDNKWAMCYEREMIKIYEMRLRNIMPFFW